MIDGTFGLLETIQPELDAPYAHWYAFPSQGTQYPVKA
jgi:hypothetical protein